MPSWAATTDSVIDHGFGAGRGGQPVTGIVIHHVAGTNGRLYVANQNSRNSHPTYHVARDGSLTGIVHPDRRPFSSGAIDVNAVTVEIDNTSAADPWPVSDAALEAVAQIIAHHAAESPRAGHAIEKNRPGTTQAGFWVAWHAQVAHNGTACPGPYVIARLDSIIDRANQIMNGGEDMPLSSEDIHRIWDAVPSSVIERVADAVVRREVGGKMLGLMVEATYDSMRDGKAGVRTTGSGLADVKSRLGRIELTGRDRDAMLGAMADTITTLAKQQGVDPDAILDILDKRAGEWFAQHTVNVEIGESETS